MIPGFRESGIPGFGSRALSLRASELNVIVRGGPRGDVAGGPQSNDPVAPKVANPGFPEFFKCRTSFSIH